MHLQKGTTKPPAIGIWENWEELGLIWTPTAQPVYNVTVSKRDTIIKDVHGINMERYCHLCTNALIGRVRGGEGRGGRGCVWGYHNFL